MGGSLGAAFEVSLERGFGESQAAVLSPCLLARRHLQAFLTISWVCLPALIQEILRGPGGIVGKKIPN